MWPLGSVVCGAHGSSGLQPSDGSAEEPGSKAVEQPWVLCGEQSWDALLLYLAIRAAQMWKLAESLDLSLVICCK